MRRIYSICVFLIVGLCLFTYSGYAELDNPVSSNATPEMKTGFPEIYNGHEGDILDTDLENLTLNALKAYENKDYETAARYYLQIAKCDIRNATAIYNLACCYGLLGKDTLAAAYLERSVKAGFTDIDHIETDPDFNQVRDSEVFKKALEFSRNRVNARKSLEGEKLFFPVNILTKGRLHLPAKYDPSKNYALVIGLHGFGSNADSFSTLWDGLKNNNIIYFALQAPYPHPALADGFSWSLIDNSDAAIQNKAMEMMESNIVNITKELGQTHKPQQIYLFGFSQGSELAYRTAIKNPVHFNGLICFGGWFDKDRFSDTQMENAKKLNVFIAHGKEDTIVEYQAAETINQTLANMGYPVVFRPFDGGHRVPLEIIHEAAVWINKNLENSTSYQSTP
ncbi:dienelactone hydrolase family protein [bacterium]|nr:dienelactone hydrolase family protein [candidate division CSSED10-310 bacterium]